MSLWLHFLFVTLLRCWVHALLLLVVVPLPLLSPRWVLDVGVKKLTDFIVGAMVGWMTYGIRKFEKLDMQMRVLIKNLDAIMNV